MKLAKLIEIDEEKCVNCHRCISACPTKFPNIGTADDVIHLNDDLCIGCGECIKACTHNARIAKDDFIEAMNAIRNKEKIIAIVAPAVSSNFPERFLKFNGWLKSLGVEAIFDVSLGAELTIKSYINHIKKNKPKAVIAQPCPAIVSYIEIYQPELIEYLAPADSPMLHIMKMIKEFYPKYKNHKMLVVSPCTAKKREFEETGIGDFNVTIASFISFIEEERINIDHFPEVDFDNDPAERAVVFSTPGGLLETAEREIPGIRMSSRKIEGPHQIYDYLKKLPEMIENGMNPLLIDCLNCEMGCNGGTGTNSQEKSPDELEYYVNIRKKKLIESYQNNKRKGNHKISDVINKYWKENLYNRTYLDLSENYYENIKEPDEKTKNDIFRSMDKQDDADIKNCASCGYNSCEIMATAIYNGINKKENCHFHVLADIGHLQKDLELKITDLTDSRQVLQDQKKEIIKRTEQFINIIGKLKELTN